MFKFHLPSGKLTQTKLRIKKNLILFTHKMSTIFKPFSTMNHLPSKIEGPTIQQSGLFLVFRAKIQSINAPHNQGFNSIAEPHVVCSPVHLRFPKIWRQTKRENESFCSTLQIKMALVCQTAKKYVLQRCFLVCSANVIRLILTHGA